MTVAVDTVAADGPFDLIAALHLAFDEEAALLSTRRLDGLAPVVATKARLTDALARALDPAAIGTLPRAARRGIAIAVDDLLAAARTNAALVRRHLDLTSDILLAIERDHARVNGRRVALYDRGGGAAGTMGLVPLSLDRRA